MRDWRFCSVFCRTLPQPRPRDCGRPPRGSPLSEGAQDKRDGEERRKQKENFSARVLSGAPSHPTSSGALPKGEPFLRALCARVGCRLAQCPFSVRG